MTISMHVIESPSCWHYYYMCMYNRYDATVEVEG